MHSNSESPPKMCSTCHARTIGEKRERHLAELGSLSVEERLARIEAWIYDYQVKGPTIPLSQMRF